MGAVGILATMLNREAPPKLTADAAGAQARRIDVTLADVERTWLTLLAAEGRAYRPPAHRYFVGATPAPCAGVGEATGPFYCAENRTYYFDLELFAALPAQLREIEDQATKLLIASVATAPVLVQFGLAGDVARGDCLAGVWAREAAARIGSVPEGRYGLAIQATRRVDEARADWWGRRPATLGGFDLGATADRDAAFRRGYAAGEIEACVRR